MPQNEIGDGDWRRFGIDVDDDVRVERESEFCCGAGTSGVGIGDSIFGIFFFGVFFFGVVGGDRFYLINASSFYFRFFI